MRALARLPRVVSFICALGLGAAAWAGSPVTKLGPNPTLGGGEYSTGGGLTVAIELRKMGDHTGLCGVWAQSEQLSVYARNAGYHVLSKGTVALNGKPITHNLDFLHRVKPSESYAGAPAGCAKLSRGWQNGDAEGRLELWIPRQNVNLTANRARGASPRVRFGPSEAENPALLQGSFLPANITSWSF